MHRVGVLPRLGAGDHPGFLSGAGVELGGTRVVLIKQAIARIYPRLEGVFINLCGMTSSGDRRSPGFTLRSATDISPVAAALRRGVTAD
jgi:hypothetical protein